MSPYRVTAYRKGPFEALELAQLLQGELDGSNVTVERFAAPGPGCEGAAVAIFNPAVVEAIAEHRPALVVGPAGMFRPEGVTALIRVQDPRLALAQLSEIFDERPLPAAGVHEAAIVAESAELGDGVRIGAGAVIEEGAEIGAGTVVGANATVGAGAKVGNRCRIHPGAVVLDGCLIGNRVTLQPGAVVGSDGFGYVQSHIGAYKIRHLGRVVLEDDVELGANSCVDRGTLGDTVIGARTKIDNQVQIGHNVRIGRDCLIAGQCGIAGSSSIGDGVVMAGGAGVGDHLKVGDGAVIGPRAAVMKDVPAGEQWIGYPAQPKRKFVRQSYLIGKLERIWKHVKGSEEDRRG